MGDATALTSMIWWWSGGANKIRPRKRFDWTAMENGFKWAELNAYVCAVFWLLTAEGLVFQDSLFRHGKPDPFPFFEAVIGGLVGPIIAIPICVFIGPLYVWMLESIVQKFEPRASSVVRADS